MTIALVEAIQIIGASRPSWMGVGVALALTVVCSIGYVRTVKVPA